MSRKEVQAVDNLIMDFNILTSEYQTQKVVNSELQGYQAKFERLQRDNQNKVLSTSGDSKQILIDFKEQNERQLSLIETLKYELERMKRENEGFRRFTKNTRES